MYLFRGGEGHEPKSPEEMEAHMGKWKTWMGILAKEEKLAGGLPLNIAGKQVKSGGVVTDGPYAEGKEVVGGYLVVNAETMEAALEISMGCPILGEPNGNIEIREMMSM